ncbi:MAG: exonuclease SbcCD subunit D [Candidatus Thorarchaeota archaeon]
MEFGFIADIHLSRYGQDAIEDETNLPERLSSIKSALYEVGTYCVENSIDTIIIGGDLLHNKSVIYAIAQDLMLDYFEDFSGINFIVIDGNHDLSGKGADVVSALRSLRNIDNVTWIPFNETYRIENILCVPYSHKVPNVVRNNKSDILISHFGLNEGVLNSGLSIISDVSLKELTGKYKLVLLGHYHKPQEILRPDISLYYVGSLIQLDWGEKGDEKRFLIVNSDTLDVQSIPITNYKKHIELELTTDNKDEIFEAAKKAKENGDHVKVIMKERVDLTSIKGEFNVIDKTERDITDRGISSSMSREDIHKRYLNIKEIPEDQANDYLNVAKRIIESCGL